MTTTPLPPLSRDLMYRAIVHEIRTPLTIIAGFSELLEDGTAGELTTRQKLYLEQIRGRSEDIELLIRNALDYARLQNGYLTLAREALTPAFLLSRQSEAFEAIAAARGVDLSFRAAPKLPDVIADPRRLGQIFDNLITNALKATPPGGSIVLGASPGAGEVAFAISDTGPGIAPDRLPRLLDPDEPETGLGLVIARHLIEAHGGTLSVVSECGTGTTFTFTLPAGRR
ncbi:MAG: Two-component hybrid sensor and regulator [Cyanobacteria bacterium RYN_339]|nr:Two-component hybrid sensor and regulator [Cyanobacteria bacterium RYN_339]